VDVPVFAAGDAAQGLHEQRRDHTWINAVLVSAIIGQSFEAPKLPRMADGHLDDLGEPVVVQSHTTTWGEGKNQLDALRVTADADGLWIGVDGVFERDENFLLIFIDVDYGEGTGITAGGLQLSDTDFGGLDAVISTVDLHPESTEVGFDMAVGTWGAWGLRLGDSDDNRGLRDFTEPDGMPDDLYWRDVLLQFDDGNVAEFASSDHEEGHTTAPDAGAVGATEHGFEARIPWDTVYLAGVPGGGADLALFAVLVNDDGGWVSNQALPPLETEDTVENRELSLQSFVVLSVDWSGQIVGFPEVVD
jgi:hypothetical protein